MTTQILLFHPDFAKSKANRALVDAVEPIDGVTVTDMQALYPDAKIDVETEVRRMLAADRLILQFPLRWYSTPPLLQEWQDTVLTRMYYIKAKEEGDRLRDMPVLVAATAGNDPSAYTPEGVNLFPLDILLNPLHSTAHRCGWRWTEPFLVFRANKSSPEDLADAGHRYAARIAAWRAELPDKPRG